MPTEIFSREFATQAKAELEKLRQPTLKKNFKKGELLVFWKEQILSFKKKKWNDEQILVGINAVAKRELFTMSDLLNFYKSIGLTEDEETQPVLQEEATKQTAEAEPTRKIDEEDNEVKKQ